MNTKIAMLPGLLLLAGTAQAQFGVRIGVNAATLATQTNKMAQYARAEGKLGYQLGILYELKLNERFSLVPELQYSHQSADLDIQDYSIADASYASRYQLKLSYLNLPVLARTTFGKFYLEAGPQLSVLQAAHEQGTESLGTIAGTTDHDFDRWATDRYRRLDVGLCLGAGVKLPAGFGLGVRGSAGFCSLTAAQDGNNYGPSLKNQALQASLSYQLKH